MPTTRSTPRTSPDSVEHDNTIRLTGRLSAVPQTRILPSGSELVSFMLVVDRPAGSRQSKDVLDCVAWTAATRRRCLRWQPGDTIELSGALRRRFWRTGTAVASRCEVEVVTASRVLRARASPPGPRRPA